MKATRLIITLAIATLIFCASATTAYAQSYIAGNLYQVKTPGGCSDPIASQQPGPRFVPNRSPDVTFLVRTYFDGIPLDFDDTYPNSSLLTEAWLTHGSNPAINVMGLPEIQYSDLSDYPCTYVSLIDITGIVTVSTGELFTFDVDDGIWLEINGILVIQRKNAGLYQNAYTGPSGTFPFRLIYIERNDFAARLKVTHN
jgi:hypothetical protein